MNAPHDIPQPRASEPVGPDEHERDRLLAPDIPRGEGQQIAVELERELAANDAREVATAQARHEASEAAIPAEIRAAARLVGAAAREVESVGRHDGDPTICLRDGTVLVVVPADRPDGAGHTGLMLLSPRRTVGRMHAYTDRPGRRHGRAAPVPQPAREPTPHQIWEGTIADREIELDQMMAEDPTAGHLRAELDVCARLPETIGADYGRTLRKRLIGRRAELADLLPAPPPDPVWVRRWVATLRWAEAVVAADGAAGAIQRATVEATKTWAPIGTYQPGLAHHDRDAARVWLRGHGLDDDGEPFQTPDPPSSPSRRRRLRRSAAL